MIALPSPACPEIVQRQRDCAPARDDSRVHGGDKEGSRRHSSREHYAKAAGGQPWLCASRGIALPAPPPKAALRCGCGQAAMRLDQARLRELPFSLTQTMKESFGACSCPAQVLCGLVQNGPSKSDFRSYYQIPKGYSQVFSGHKVNVDAAMSKSVLKKNYVKEQRKQQLQRLLGMSASFFLLPNIQDPPPRRGRLLLLLFF